MNFFLGGGIYLGEMANQVKVVATSPMTGVSSPEPIVDGSCKQSSELHMQHRGACACLHMCGR